MKKLVCGVLCGLFILSGCAVNPGRPDVQHRGETISQSRFEVVNGTEDAAGFGMSGAAADVADDSAAGGKHASH